MPILVVFWGSVLCSDAPAIRDFKYVPGPGRPGFQLTDALAKHSHLVPIKFLRVERRQSLVSWAPGIRTREGTLQVLIQCVTFTLRTTETMVDTKHMPDCDVTGNETNKSGPVICVLYLPMRKLKMCVDCEAPQNGKFGRFDGVLRISFAHQK